MKQKRPIWSRLKDYRCPFCATDLKANHITHGHECPKCTFYIGEEKLKQIIAGGAERPKSHRQQEEENQEGLNSV